MKLTKKEVKKYYSFGLVGIDDEWVVVGKWENFTKYKNRDGLTLTTVSTDAQDMMTKMFQEMNIVVSDEAIILASPDVLVAIEKTLKDSKNVQ
jgi:hypothetical protein